MKLAFSVHIDVDDHTLPSSRSQIRDHLAEDIRGRLTAALDDVPVALRQVRVWSRAAPDRRRRLTVESIEKTGQGRYRVTVRADDNRRSRRIFATQHAAETWANKIDPLPLPDDPVV